MQIKYAGLFLLIISLLFFCSGCYFNKPNMRTYEKDNVKFQGNINVWTGKEYYSGLTILGSNEKTIKSNIFIELKNGNRQRLSELTADLIRKNSPQFKLVPTDNGCFEARIDDPMYVFEIDHKDDMVFFYCSGYRDEKGAAILWNSDLTKRYVFPLTRQEVIELFGDPDRILVWSTH